MKIRDQFHRIIFVTAVSAIAVAGLAWRARNVRAQEQTHPAAPQTGQEQQPSATKPTTAGDAYMNIQILKDIPSDQLLPSMRYITVALGVECEFCHVPKNFESDDKPEKATARKMMQMMFAVNKDNFDGRREVTCYTCHRGMAHASNIPMLTATGAAPVMGVPAPTATGAPAGQAEHANGPAAAPQAPKVTVDEIIAKYADALGGASAIEKITTLEEKGSVQLPFRGGLSASAELVRKAPDKMLWVVRLPNGGELVNGYNGAAAWQGRPGHAADDLTGDELARAKEGAVFVPGLDLKQDFSRAQVVAIDKIGDRDAYRVIAFRKGGGQVRFYYDTQSGLLLRISERIQSPLGDLPQDTYFSDYRDVEGVKLPFTVTMVNVEGAGTYKWDQIQANLPVEDTRFDKPAQKPEEKAASK